MPSFKEIFSYYYRNKLYVNGELVRVPSWTVDKLAVAEFCDKHGIPTGKVLATWGQPSDIKLSNLPNSFVIKPSNLNTARGVQVLERTGENEYFDHFTETSATLDDIIDYQQVEYEKIQSKEGHRLKRYKIMAQERMTDKDANSPVATDYKIWVVGNEVQYVRVVDRESRGGKLPMCFYDGNFEILPEANGKITLKPQHAYQAEHRVPDSTSRKSLLDLAERVSELVQATFLRVDLYLTASGPKLGEITTVPGSPYTGKYFSHSTAFDQEMGDKWATALGITDDSWRS